MKPIKKIAVVGATGMLGIPVSIALMEAGFEVTALARNVEQARRVLPAAIRVVAADLRDEESLRAGLRGQDGLYLSLSVGPGARKGDFHTVRHRRATEHFHRIGVGGNKEWPWR